MLGECVKICKTIRPLPGLQRRIKIMVCFQYLFTLQLLSVDGQEHYKCRIDVRLRFSDDAVTGISAVEESPFSFRNGIPNSDKKIVSQW